MGALEQVILDTLAQAGIYGPPVNIEKVLKVLGLDDIFIDYSKPPMGGTSLFFDDLKRKWRIRLLPSLPPERRTFDLAHECVEYLALREEFKGPHYQINEGAAELLIPRKWAEECIRKNGLDLFALKRLFSTASFDTCALRLLRLSPWPCTLVVVTENEKRVMGRKKKAGLSPDEEVFVNRAFRTLTPLLTSKGRKLLRSFPIPDEKRLKIKKAYIYVWDRI
ncbi:MAG: ImmA/IrrE family metallo-endopeptidase [Caldiserica bacterium]|jgi:hypothetical protein|nr:ImmA/IrrE family metallo-endopeptidase [Caldisericota bacterium]